MKTVFADTFYWAALTSIEDGSHVRALAFSRSARLDGIVTTDEVLVEYLAFFASARPSCKTGNYLRMTGCYLRMNAETSTPNHNKSGGFAPLVDLMAFPTDNVRSPFLPVLDLHCCI